jgi:hypothetical protein
MISKAVQTLLDRMNEFPNEFVDSEFNMANDTFCTVWERTRWAGATKQMLEDDDHNVFTNEERECYLARLRAIIRAKFDEDVCRALLEIKEKYEFMQKQMELPGMLTTQQVTREALKVLEQELNKQELNKSKKLVI